MLKEIFYKHNLYRAGKYFLFFLIITTLITYFTNNISAHFRGKPFIKIDGEFTTIYTLEEGLYIGDTPMPSDAAPKRYLINQKIIFEADPTQLPFPKEVVDRARFIWDFDDGTKLEGLKVEHTYLKAGSFEVNISIEYGDLSSFGLSPTDPSAIPPQNQQVLVHILPDATYELPKPVVLVDGVNIDTLRKDKLGLLQQTAAIVELYDHYKWFKMPKTVVFDASKTSGSSKVVKYLWSFDEFDDKPKSGSKVTKVFKDDFFLYDVALRVVDENNFYVDSFLKIANKDKDEKDINPNDYNIRVIDRSVIYIIVGLSASLVIFALTKIFKRNKNDS